MPTYSYLCSACGHDFDQYQAFTDDALTVCPVCGEAKLRKVFSNIGVSFNGSGFYRTDSRSESGGSAGKSATETSKPKSTDAPSSTPAPAAAPSTTSTSSP